MHKITQLGEFGLISRFARKITTDKSVICGIGDDAAVVKWKKDKYLLLASDMIVEGRHFSKKDNPGQIGHKALAVTLSDIAAMGGLPKYALISMAIPKNKTARYIDNLYQGIISLAKKFDINIVGGDTNSSSRLTIDVVLLAEVEKKNLVLRSGARKGDLIFVSGKLGGSLKSGHHLKFMPRIKEARYLVNNFKISSMIDISDGLIADLGHILEKSNVGAIIYEELIPKNKYAPLLEDVLYSGEDFELLFTLPLEEVKKLKKARYSKDMQFFMIGEIIERRGIILFDKHLGMRKLKIEGFRHF